MRKPSSTISSSTSIDPVCGMTVDPAVATRASFQGEVYFFCADACRAAFEGEPETFLQAGPKPASSCCGGHSCSVR